MKTLSEQYFEEFLGSNVAGAVGRGIGSNFSKAGKALRDRVAKKGQSIGRALQDPKSRELAKSAGASTGGKIGNVVGRGAHVAAVAGAAYLAYKGLKGLYNKYKQARTPEDKQKIKAQIQTQKQKVVAAKNKGK